MRIRDKGRGQQGHRKREGARMRERRGKDDKGGQREDEGGHVGGHEGGHESGHKG